MERLTCPNLFADLPLPVGKDNLLLYGGIGAGVALLLVLLVLALRRGRKPIDPEAGLAEDLATYPPPPKSGGRLRVNNQFARLRLVVVAPVGKKPLAEPETVLEGVLSGLGDVAAEDRPRIRVWPPQLSTRGFGPTFLRLTRKPEPEGKPSRWVLLAGPARSAGQPVLLGLALLTQSPGKLGPLLLDEVQWGEVLQVTRA
jgi:hypothetical protein